MPAHPPGDQKLAPLGLVGLTGARHRHRRSIGDHPVAGLDEQAAVDAAHVERFRARRPLDDEHADPRFGGEVRRRLVVEPRAHNGFEKGLGERCRGGEVERPVDADDAAVRRTRVALVCTPVRVDGVLADGEAARVGVLDHAGGRLVELGHQRARRVDVEPVGEGERRPLQLARVSHAAGRSGTA